MTTLFGLDIKAIIGGALAGQLYPATLHKRTSATGAAGQTVSTFTDYVGEGVRLRWRTQDRVAFGYPATAVKVLLPQAAFAAAPAREDALTILGTRYRIIDEQEDPAQATWVLAAVPAGASS